jgi:MFS family permease
MATDPEKQQKKDEASSPVLLPTSSKPELHDTVQGSVTDELVLSKDGFALFPQPVLSDELDPLNWSSFQKHTILAIIMALYFMFTYITTTTVPSFPVLEETYEATLEMINWTVAIPALGLSLGPLLWASPADIIGRRPILILGTIMALAATIGAALAPTYQGYMAARFFQGLGVSPASNVGLAVINDVFFEHERGQKLGLWVLAIDMGLLFGPLIGGFVSLAGHQWIQWLTAILLGVILLAEVVFLPETLYPRRLMSAEGKEKGEVKRTKTLGMANVKPLPGMTHPKVWDTLVRFIKTFKFAAVSVAVMTYCFGWYWWVLSVVTLVPVAYGEAYPDAHVQG